MIGWFVGIALALVLVFALLAPLESLRWWGRRKDVSLLSQLLHDVGQVHPEVARPDPRGYVVYLSGIASVDGTSDSRRERAVLAELAASLPDVVLAADVFPYAVDNRGLTQRASAWFWGRLSTLQRVPVARTVAQLINLRNGLRVLVSADPRYGPTYNLAVAHEVAASLARHGYRRGSGVPVTVVGYSGGGQIALGAAWYLAGSGLPVSVVSLGGVLSSDPALDRVRHVWHLYGSRDRVQRLGAVVFPGRWPWARLSAWQAAVDDGRLTRTCIGPMRHTGGRDYYDRHRRVEDGRSYRELTLEALRQVLTGHQPEAFVPGGGTRRADGQLGTLP